MTMKEIIKMANNSEVMYMLEEIAEIQANMCFKTIYEQKTAMKKIKNLAKEIQEICEE